MHGWDTCIYQNPKFYFPESNMLKQITNLLKQIDKVCSFSASVLLSMFSIKTHPLFYTVDGLIYFLDPVKIIWNFHLRRHKGSPS